MKPTIFSTSDLERMSQQWDHGKITSRDLEQVVVDLDQLSKEVTMLVDTCISIGSSLRALALSLQEQV